MLNGPYEAVQAIDMIGSLDDCLVAACSLHALQKALKTAIE